MKKSLFFLTALSLISTSVLANKNSVHNCYSTEQTYISNDQSIYVSVDSSELPNELDSHFPVEVIYKSKVCITSSIEILAEGDLLDIPATPQEGDTRTVTQTRGHIRSTYSQNYKDGRWETKSLVKDIVDIPIEPV